MLSFLLDSKLSRAWMHLWLAMQFEKLSLRLVENGGGVEWGDLKDKKVKVQY